MNEEIKQLIELHINARIIENRSNYALFNEGMRKGSEIAKEFILSKWQEANRWRKVSEELPKVKVKPSESYQILVRLPDGYIGSFWVSTQQSVEYVSKTYTQWKPIE